jgi:hypothetical protein
MLIKFGMVIIPELRNEHRLRVFENGLTMRVFEYMREEIRCGWNKKKTAGQNS